jgi:hypothetical protein
MLSHWNYCKENNQENDVADPGLDYQVAQNTLRISIFYAYQSVEQNDLPDEIGRLAEQIPPMIKPATDIIRYISVSNWSVCNAVWKSNLQSCSNAEGRMEVRPLRMLDNMTMDLECLTSVIRGRVSCYHLTTDLSVFAFLPKRAQDVVAVSLRKAIMSWIDENPNDLTKLYSVENTVSFHADKLFDVIMSLPETNSRRETLWPLAMSLLLLCPDVVVPAVHATLGDSRARNDYNYSRVSKKVIFLDNVRKCLKIDGLAELAAICLTDFAKAVYMMPRTDNDLVRYLIAYEKELCIMIFDTQSRIYKHSRDRSRLSQLVSDKLFAIYRANKKEFWDIALHKTYHPSANTYVTYNMARFCRDHERKTNVKLHCEDFGDSILIAAKIRRHLQHLLKTISPGSPSALPDRSSRGALPVDKIDLIIEMLRNYMSNIEIALAGTKLDNRMENSSDKQVYAETEILDFIIEETVGSKDPDIAEAGADFVELLYAPENAWRWSEYAKANPDEGHLFWQYTYNNPCTLANSSYPLTFLMAQKVINPNVEREVALQAMQRLHSCYANAITILKSNKVSFLRILVDIRT